MQEPNKRVTGQIPEFANLQEAAAFWDTHSPLDFPDEIEEVEIAPASKTHKRGLTVKLDESTIKQLDAIAREQGVGSSTLARMWILDHLRARSSVALGHKQH